MNVDVYSISFKILLLGIGAIFYIFIFRELAKSIMAHLFAGITPLPSIINIFLTILSLLVPQLFNDGKIFTIKSSELINFIKEINITVFIFFLLILIVFVIASEVLVNTVILKDIQNKRNSL